MIALNLITASDMVMWRRTSIFWPWTWISTVSGTCRAILWTRFAEASRDPDLLQMLDFYKCYRAYVRGKIHAFTAQDPAQPGGRPGPGPEDGPGLFCPGRGVCRSGGAMGRLIVVVFGLMGTGKSNRSRALAPALGWPVIHSDAVRKTLAGLKPTNRVPVDFGQGIYDEDFSTRTYDEMLRQADAHLAAGQSVILDGSYKRAAERDRVRQLAQDTGRPGGVRVLRMPPGGGPGAPGDPAHRPRGHLRRPGGTL